MPLATMFPILFCIKKKLIIELDGSQHLEQTEHDEERTAYLQSQGYKVIRFWNNAVMKDIEGVMLRNSKMKLKEMH